MSVTNLGPWIEPPRRPRLDSDTPVSRLMSTVHPDGAKASDLPSVNALTTVREATHLMASQGVLQIHVRDTLGRVVGLLTVSDLYRWVAESPNGYDDGPTAGHA